MKRTVHVAVADARALPLPDGCVDAVVTDCPYGLEFMGKEWDRFAGQVSDRQFKGFVLPTQRTRNVKCPDCDRWIYDHPGRACECGGVQRTQTRVYQAWCQQWAAEVLRVLRPGGWLLCFGGTRTWHRLACGIEDAGMELRDQVAGFSYGPLAWLYGQGYPKSKASLKPGWEPIVVARRPGRSVLQVDAARVEGPTGDGHWVRNGELGTHGIFGGGGQAGEDFGNRNPAGGRWPANVVLDEAAAALLDELTGDLPVAGGFPAARRADKHRTTYGAFRGDVTDRVGHVDLGTRPSRFFYTAKADGGERVTLDGEGHPTVKPLALMRWLVRLVARPGDLVLDPFCGSGSTGEACMLEGMRAVLFDNDPASVVKAIARTDPLVRRTRMVTVDGATVDADPRLF